MDVTLPGPRVLLRTLRESDAQDMLRAVRDPELRRLTGTHRTFTLADTLSWAASRRTAPGRYDWAVTADGRWLGDCALTDIDTDNRSAGFRIALDPQHAGQGYGTEATGLVLDFAFGELGLYRVELEVFDFNVRAQKSYAKSGFTPEGIKRGGLLWEGQRHDIVCMAALDPGGNTGATDSVQ